MDIKNSFNMANNQDNMRISKNNQPVVEKSKSGLSVDDFLQIMAAEIKNQNPMGSDGGGGSKTDYLSQLAQFTMLEQMTEIGQNLDTLNYMGQQQYAFSLIGKEVKVHDEEGPVTGIVEKAKIVNGFATIQVNGQEYYLGSLIEVAEGESTRDCEVCEELADIILSRPNDEIDPEGIPEEGVDDEL